MDDINFKLLLFEDIALISSDFLIGKDLTWLGNFLFNFLKQLLSFLYISTTSISALKIGQLNNFEIKDFPEAILPSTQTLIINSFINYYIHLPPSTSKTTPVIILASSEHKKQAAFPISCGVENLPMGIVERNACFFL